MTTTPLGEYLRGRRAQLTPEALGLPVYGRRRVPGLRREEVAMLTGVSVDYYVRLEQGRETNPSPQVLDSLGEVLRLDHDGRQHLYRLAGFSPRPEPPAPVEEADPELVELMLSWRDSPAIVLGRAFDVLATNPIAEALFTGFAFSRNLTRTTFLDPAARTFYPDWHVVAENAAAALRLADGQRPGDPAIRGVVDELRVKSPDFVAMWDRADARGKRLTAKRFLHPDVGHLELRVHGFGVLGAPGQELVVYHATPGSPAAEALSLLGTIAATRAFG
ncbi:helix-turn-helix transcriptional regulator [Promicromonospora thailandica]|uniref:Transcriptional regulator, contains XRE-family HTH domain n=1 Tax=Promicromonospora thailandica TaxID=765201 RepID=A0A9X2G635_9MICO|nr:helix-turn-helix transcriptional regulator [Promicromonospora thailandica]MCP2263231.1 Transcriptional regulator, contains XRE-family HTH domain [Promicromonospora thailandica]BFF18620.1 helix-turn-helix transcriptional regulator [Promicromonospora thailandica]